MVVYEWKIRPVETEQRFDFLKKISGPANTHRHLILSRKVRKKEKAKVAIGFPFAVP